MIDQINGTGFGLTMGVHSRIEERCEYLAKMSRAGNVYINRNMIGAIVGVQPFGGRGYLLALKRVALTTYNAL